MKELVLYIHGKDGCAGESKHYRPLFPEITAFAKTHGAELTVMEDGEHWFHTDEQMRFLDNRIIKRRSIR